MKTLIKILRSTITSLLFLTLTVFIIVQFCYTAFRNSAQNIPKLIDRDRLMNLVIDESIEDDEIKKVVYKYLDDYISYIFHKRSYPSLQTVDLSQIEESKIEYAKDIITDISKKLNLEYDDVITLRNINNTISNGSIYLLINIGVFLVFIVVIIVTYNFKKGLKLLSISMFTSSFLVLIGFSPIIDKLSSRASEAMNYFLTVIFDEQFLKSMNNQVVVYASIGLLIFLIIKIYERFILPILDKK